MPFPFTCPHCHAKTLVEDRFAGQSGPCAQCGQVVTVPMRGGGAQALPSPALEMRAKSKSKWIRNVMFALSSVLIIGVIMSVLALIALPALQQANELRKRSLSLSNLRQIASALNAYATKHGSYPPPVVCDAAGKPLYSWRVLILPELGHRELFDEFNKSEAWDSETNLKFHSRMPTVYASPGSPDAQTLHQSNYVLLVGNGTLFPKSGPLGMSIQDQTNQTILVTETANAGKSWTEPFDIDVSKGAKLGTVPYLEIGGNHKGEAVAVTVSGDPLILPDTISNVALDALITPNGLEKIDTTAYRER